VTLHLGLIGAGIQKSRSPALHEHEAKAQGLQLSYELIDLDKLGVGIEALPRLLADAKHRGLAGLNITYPCKQAVIPLLDDLSSDARALNAVNTVVIRDGRLTGHNTDWSGFAEGFRRASGEIIVTVDSDSVVERGALLAIAGPFRDPRVGAVELTIFDVDRTRATELAASVGAKVATDLAAAMAAADGLIHCTPTGMAKMPGLPLDAQLIERRHWVAEIVYVPLETELLRLARAKGCRTVDGGGMAVFQAAGAFRLFTGLEPDAERMLRHFRSMGA